jgi:small subunit ribosomal protein S6
MRRYETFVIVDPDISKDERDTVMARVKELIDQMGGFLVFEDDWGERKLAYEIKKRERGYYVRYDYCGLAPLVNEIERFFRIDDRALKYMTVVLEKDADLAKIKAEKSAAESKSDALDAPEETRAEVDTVDSTDRKGIEEEAKLVEDVKSTGAEIPVAESTQVKNQEEA